MAGIQATSISLLFGLFRSHDVNHKSFRIPAEASAMAPAFHLSGWRGGRGAQVYSLMTFLGNWTYHFTYFLLVRILSHFSTHLQEKLETIVYSREPGNQIKLEENCRREQAWQPDFLLHHPNQTHYHLPRWVFRLVIFNSKIPFSFTKTQVLLVNAF